MLFIQCKNYMATSESKGRFFLQNESIRITNRVESIRIANWNVLFSGTLLSAPVNEQLYSVKNLKKPLKPLKSF